MVDSIDDTRLKKWNIERLQGSKQILWVCFVRLAFRIKRFQRISGTMLLLKTEINDDEKEVFPQMETSAINDPSRRSETNPFLITSDAKSQKATTDLFLNVSLDEISMTRYRRLPSIIFIVCGLTS